MTAAELRAATRRAITDLFNASTDRSTDDDREPFWQAVEDAIDAEITAALTDAHVEADEHRFLIREAAALIRTSSNLGGTGMSLEELRTAAARPHPPEPPQ